MFRFYSKPQGSLSRVVVVGEHQDGLLKIAVARCSKKDSFVRKKGRNIAEGRLAKGKIFGTIDLEECDGSLFVKIASAVAAAVSHYGMDIPTGVAVGVGEDIVNSEKVNQ